MRFLADESCDFTVVRALRGAQDAPVIAREFAPKFEPEDLISLPNHHVYLRLLIDGEPSKPFSAERVGWPRIDKIGTTAHQDRAAAGPEVSPML